MGKLNIKNRTIFCLDNLQVMQAINSSCVDLIYLDPPFSKNDTWEATNRHKIAEIKKWFKTHQQEQHFKDVNFDNIFQNISYKDIWTQDDIKDIHFANLNKDRPQLSEFLNSVSLINKSKFYYLVFMAVRLLECHRLLKDTGSFYLHCDPEMSHYLKLLLDCIFGEANFRNEIIWQRNDGRGKGSQYRAKKFGANTDSILFYTKTDDFYLNIHKPLSTRQQASKFNKIDQAGRRYYTGIPVFRSKSMGTRPNLCFTWRGFTNPHPSGWRLSKDRLEAEYQQGNIVIKGDKIERRKYADDYEGAPLDNNWVDIPRLTVSKESVGYPTQKPLALLARIIRASSKEGDVVLDPFCGCATTCVAAEQLNRQWIGIDINPQAYYLNLYRMYEQEGLELAGSNIKNGRLYSTGKFQAIIDAADLPKRDDISAAELKKQASAARQEAKLRRQWQQKQAGKQARLLYERHKELYKELLYNDQNGFCAGCGAYRRLNDLTIDHIVPQADDNPLIKDEARQALIHSQANLQLLCHRDNSFKGVKSMEHLLKRLKAEKLIDQATYNGKRQHWCEFRQQTTDISQLYKQVFPKS